MAKIYNIDTKFIYQIKVTLLGSEPEIWRTFQVPENYTLHKLHKVLQIVMGWKNYHLYEFKLGGISYGEPHSDYDGLMKNAKGVKLNQISQPEKVEITYIYDFGDGWQHKIIVEKLFEMEANISYPFCIDGARACPPEDCGGIGGYAYFLDAIHDPMHEEHKQMLGWIGGEFNPETFNIKSINEKLSRIK